PLGIRAKLAMAVEIVSAYVRVRILLRRYDLVSVAEVLRREMPPPAAGLEGRRGQAMGVRLGKAVGRTLRPLPFDSRCLVRSLVLTSMLARRGVASSVVIGVTLEPK